MIPKPAMFDLSWVDRDPKMFNCDMVLYYLRHYINSGKSPKEMIDLNTRGPRLVLGIPNNNVRKQYYEFMLEEV